MFLFGRSVEQIAALQNYQPEAAIEKSPRLQGVFAFLEETLPSVQGGEFLYPLLASLKDSDRQRVLLDFDEYSALQDRVDQLYRDRGRWLAMSLANIAGAGWYSSDRSVAEYGRNVWKVDSVGTWQEK
jgi:starch phosphorylase